MVRAHQCPVCDKACQPANDPQKKHFPFCSDRCRMIDLSRWADGRYAIVENVDPIEAELLQHDPDITVVSDDQ